MDSAAIARTVADAPGFVGWLRPEVVRSSREEAVLRLDDRPELHNHVGGPHAAVLFGLAETTALVVLLEVFGDLVEQGAVPLIKGSEIGYSALATGPVVATGRFVDDEQSARDAYAAKGTAVFAVEVVLSRESDGQPTAVVRPQMAVKRFS